MDVVVQFARGSAEGCGTARPMRPAIGWPILHATTPLAGGRVAAGAMAIGEACR